MKKALPHILYILVIVFLGVLSQINRAKAERNQILATTYAEKAEQAAEDAMHAAAEARKADDARMEAVRLLKECKGK